MKLPGNRDKKIIDGTHRIVFYLLPLLGLAFLLWYIKNAACDVVYSDYIRLVNSYLPDVFNPEKFFVADVLTRIPINYLSRIINVKFFGFSITFDRVLGAVSVSLAAWCFAAYSRQLKINIKWFITFMIVMFSLNKWEMLTNGSGWSHFFAFACFYYHQILFDRYYRGQERKWDKTILMLLPWLIILGTAGPYCAIYAVVMILASGAAAFMDTGEKRKQYVIFLICTLIPLLLYILSNSFAVEEHAGATGRSLGEILKDFPTFPIRFILKSLAGMMVGGEELQQWIANGCISNKIIYLLGVILMVGYLWSLWLNISLGIYKKTFFPLILLVSGGANHLLIFLSRYIFEKEDYALSSRYALQFQVGVLGILLTFALASQIRRKRINGGLVKRTVPVLETVFCIAILIGNGYTTYREIQKAPYREENFEKMAEMAPQIPFMSDQELKVAGGFGTRISEESHLKPKPMIEIGEKPILWHIMKYYSEFGYHDFVICLGYKQYVVKEFFADYFLHTSDVTFDLANNSMEVHNNYSEPWKVTLVDTGLNTMTGGRVKRIQPYIGNEPFMLTYGDGVSNVDLNELVAFHKSHGKIATITTVNLGQSKGVLNIAEDNTVLSFREKDDNDGALINGGFMVMNPEIFDYLEGDSTIFEQGPMQKLAAEGQMKSFYHGGFWQCMDTQREMKKLEELWQSGKAPWKIWKD